MLSAEHCMASFGNPAENSLLSNLFKLANNTENCIQLFKITVAGTIEILKSGFYICVGSVNLIHSDRIFFCH